MGIVSLLCSISIWAVCLMIALCIAAAILKLSCSLAGAEVPDTGRAMVTCVLESLVAALVRLTVVLSVAYVVTRAKYEKPDMLVMVGMVFLVLAFVVPAGIYMPMLRVSFGKGMVIALIRYVITSAIVVAVGLVLMSMTGKNSFAQLF